MSILSYEVQRIQFNKLKLEHMSSTVTQYSHRKTSDVITVADYFGKWITVEQFLIMFLTVATWCSLCVLFLQVTL